MAVRARGSTGWLMLSLASGPAGRDAVSSGRPAASKRGTCVVSFDDADALWRTDSLTPTSAFTKLHQTDRHHSGNSPPWADAASRR